MIRTNKKIKCNFTRGQAIYPLAPKKPNHAFSLIELLIMIAIIAILISILTPSLGKAKAFAYRIKCAHNLKQINLAVSLYLNENKDTYPSTDANDIVGYDATGNPIWLWMGRGWRSYVEPYLGGDVDANNPSVLFCPQDKSKDYESTSYAYSMAFYHSPDQIDTVNCTSIHNEQWDPSYAQKSMPQRSCSVTNPSGKILIGEWESNHVRIDYEDRWWCKGWWSDQGARNFLFADGQIRFLKPSQIRPANDGKANPNLTTNGIKGIDWPRE